MAEWKRGEFEISTDPARIDLDAVYRFLSTEAYWAPGVPLDVVQRAIAGSIPFGVYRGHEQVGFARVVSDRATFAWIADVFIVTTARGNGLGKWLMECIVAHPDLQGLRRWMLATRDAHGLYKKTGFKELHDATRFMERFDPEIYSSERLRGLGREAWQGVDPVHHVRRLRDEGDRLSARKSTRSKTQS